MGSDSAGPVCRCGRNFEHSTRSDCPNGRLGGLRGRMMSIGKLAAGPGAGRYYIDQVAQGREDYYAGEGEAAGVWMGTGAAWLGLTGEVRRGGPGAAARGPRPESRVCCCGRSARRVPVAGFDLTFRAPKSVSILFGVAEPDVARRVDPRARAGGRRRRSGTSSARRAGLVAVARRRDPAAGAGLRRGGVPAPVLARGRSAAAYARGGRERHAGRGRSLDGARRPRAVPAREDRRLPLPGRAAGGAVAGARAALAGRRARDAPMWRASRAG